MEKIEKKKERKGKRKKKQMFCEKSCLVFRLVFGTIDTEKRKRGRKNESRNERICGVIVTSQKMIRKTLIIRIFCELRPKMKLESQYLCGF